jgi:biopolymer transport protein TolQ
MMAFCGMAAQGKADINALAPGVSGALLTTVVALIVAIPSLIGFNALAGGVHRTLD